MDAEECILLISVLFLRVFYHFEVPIKSVKWQSLKKKIVKLNSLSISQLYTLLTFILHQNFEEILSMLNCSTELIISEEQRLYFR